MSRLNCLKLACGLLLLQLVATTNCGAGWIREYTKPGEEVIFRKYALSDEGELFITYGGIWSNQSSFHLSSMATAEISKIDSQGNNQWNSRYTLAGPDGEMNLYPQAIMATDDGGSFVISQSWEYSENPYFERPSHVFMKLDSSGEVEWAHRFYHGFYTTRNSFGIGNFQIIRTTDGGYAVSATCFEHISGKSGRVLRFDQYGSLLWQTRFHLGTIPRFRDMKKYVGNYSLNQLGLAEGADGSILVIGRGDNYSIPNRIYLTKLGSNGSLVWQKISTEQVNNIDKYKPTPDGGLIVKGTTAAGLTALIKFDGDGDIAWQETLNLEYGMSLYDITLTQDNGYVLTFADIHVNPSLLLHLIKLGETGNVEWERAFEDSSSLKRGSFILAEVNDTFSVASNDGTTSMLAKIDSSGQLSNCVGSVVMPNHQTGPLSITMVEVDAIAIDGIFSEVPGAEILRYDASLLDTVGICNQPPHADPGTYDNVPCAGPAGAPVQLNGSGSSDPDGDPLTYTWTGPFGEATGANPLVTLPLDDSVITLTVSDGNETDSAEVTITVEDTCPPHTGANINGNTDIEDWYNTPVTVNLHAEDGCSGVASLTNGVNDAPLTTVTGADVAIDIGEGENIVRFQATDQAGNAEELNRIQVNIDLTPPVILIAGIGEDAVYPSCALPEPVYQATDSLSGVAFATATTTGSGSDIVTYTYSVTATDMAGNSATAEASYEVVEGTAGLAELVRRFLNDGLIEPQMGNSLLKQLENGDDLTPFVNHVKAQTGKKIDPAAADMLLNAAACAED